MKNRPRIRISVIAILSLVCSCKSSDNSSAYDDMLSKKPFAPLTDSIKRQPSNDTLYFRRAVLLNTNNLPEPALVDFNKAWALKKDERYAFGIANLLLDKKPDSATVFLSTALKELPESFLLQLTLARALSEQEKLDEALAICEKMLVKDPGEATLLKMKADLLDRKGNKNDAIAVLNKAYTLNPADVELNYMLALKLAEAKNSRVLALSDSLIKADSLGIHAEPYYYKGIYYANIDDKQKALALFDNAIKIDINFLDGYIEKGSLLYDMKKYQDAIAVFNLCLTVSPKFADSYYWIAKCQEAMGLVEEAKANYQRAYNLDGKLVEAKAALEKLGR